MAIIGGGLAGLASAYKLKKNSIPFYIFEGRDRLGGRVHTKRIDSQNYYEEGATFIDHDHEYMLRFSKILKVPLEKVDFSTKQLLIVHNHTIINNQEIDKVLNGTQKKLSTIWKYLRNKEEIKNLVMLPFLNKLSRQGKNFLITHYADMEGRSLPEESVKIIPKLIESLNFFKRFINNQKHRKKNKYFYYLIKNGSSNFVKKFEKNVGRHNTLLCHKITEIKKIDHKYLLKFQCRKNKKSILAKKIIITLPFSTLRNVKIHSSIKLSELQKKSIKSLKYWKNGKIGAKVSPQIRDNIFFYMNLDCYQTGWLFGSSPQYFTLMPNGKYGSSLNQINASKISHELIKFCLPNDKTHLINLSEIQYKNWYQDHFSLGCYTSYSYQFSKPSPLKHCNGMEQFANPIEDNIFFAGEHTRFDATKGYMEGAIISGLQASKLLINSLKK